MIRTSRALSIRLAAACLAASIIFGLTSATTDADLFRYADFVADYSPGAGQFPGFESANITIGPPSALHRIEGPQNTHPETGDPVLTSLGQHGSLTLGFNQPVTNQPQSEQNPHGYDLLVVGNAFQGGSVITAEFDFGRWSEPGFIEVAQSDTNGNPIEWFLILPRIFNARPGLHVPPFPIDVTPNQLQQPIVDDFGFPFESGDVGSSATLLDGMVDTTPMNGAAFATALASNDIADVVLDNPATFNIEGIGGSGVDLSRAVRQTPGQPGIPLETSPGEFSFVSLTSIDYIRITDVFPDDVHADGLGPVTTEVDAVIVLPQFITSNIPGDANNDGRVNAIDLNIWLAHLGQTSATLAQGDFNLDGTVDGFDYAIWQANFGTIIPTDPFSQSASIPEPMIIWTIIPLAIALHPRKRWNTTP